jgi:hypothetical protein
LAEADPSDRFFRSFVAMTKGQEDERRKINSSLNTVKTPAKHKKQKLTEHSQNTRKTQGH